MGYESAFIGQKTSLKKTCKGGSCLSNEFDNIWFNSKNFAVANAKVIHFYQDFDDFLLAREISDHIPLTIVLTIL
jgi:hypothetical protein